MNLRIFSWASRIFSTPPMSLAFASAPSSWVRLKLTYWRFAPKNPSQILDAGVGVRQSSEKALLNGFVFGHLRTPPVHNCNQVVLVLLFFIKQNHSSDSRLC